MSCGASLVGVVFSVVFGAEPLMGGTAVGEFHYSSSGNLMNDKLLSWKREPL